MLYNFQLLKYAGENGVAAYGVLMYVNMIFLAMFIGYSTGTAPIVSYHYGAGNHGATTTDSQMPSSLNISGRMRMAATSKTRLRKNEISAEVTPSLSAVKKDEP